MKFDFTRRTALIGGGFIAFRPWDSIAVEQDQSISDEILTDDLPLGFMGDYDANYLGPALSMGPRGPFVFPADAESDTAYGIDISHYTEAVPWAGLSGVRVKYVYIKASQALKRDGKFEMHWQAAKEHGIPRGAYHWLTPGIGGKEQGDWLVARIKAAGGLEKGDLQPVIDLEWDYLGKTFKKTILSYKRVGGKNVPQYKDYWADHSRDAIVAEVDACIAAIKAGFPGLNVVPVIYTNRSWWDIRLGSTVRFGCPVWPADFREKSHQQGMPRLVVGHDYHCWQFTEKGAIVVDGKRFGPFDCNRIIKGTLANMLVT